MNMRLSKPQCEAHGRSESEVSSASSTEGVESNGARWGFDASTVLPRKFARVGFHKHVYVILRFLRMIMFTCNEISILEFIVPHLMFCAG